MENYEQQIYSFLTQRQNCEPFLNLVGHYEMIRKELLEKFWGLIEQKVNEKFKTTTEVSGWEARLENVFGQHGKLYCFNHSWRLKEDSPVLVSWESLAFKPYVGLWLDHNQSKDYNLESFKKGVQPFAKENNYRSKDNNKSWAFWRYADIDFNKQESLLEILPDVQEQLAEQLSEELFDLVLSMDEELMKFYKVKG